MLPTDAVKLSGDARHLVSRAGHNELPDLEMTSITEE